MPDRRPVQTATPGETDVLPRVAITLGDPRGVGPEIVGRLLADPEIHRLVRPLVIGPDPLVDAYPWHLGVGPWTDGGEEPAGVVSGRAIQRAIELAIAGEIDGVVTGPISKRALSAAGYAYPGHTEFLRDATATPEVTMMMAAETTPLGGALRMAVLTGHVSLRDALRRLSVDHVVTRTRIAVKSLSEWWGLARPRIAFAGVNPHASEDGLFGDEERNVLEPAAAIVAADGHAEVSGVFPADTVFRRCISGEVDAVVVPYHDLGLAVIKTLARDTGVNVTAGLPFPRTSPDHGTAMDIAGRGVADPTSFRCAVELCALFCRRRATEAP
jgi:4-hydroxythreonine-4-phosphate dehydrogenase